MTEACVPPCGVPCAERSGAGTAQERRRLHQVPRLHRAGTRIPPPPSRTTWTRLVHPSVLIGHVLVGTGTASSRSRCRRAPAFDPHAPPAAARKVPRERHARVRGARHGRRRAALSRGPRARGSASASACASRMTLRPAPRPTGRDPHPGPAHEPRERLCAHGAERCMRVSWAGLGGRTWRGCWRGTRSPTPRKWTTMSLSSRTVRPPPPSY